MSKIVIFTVLVCLAVTQGAKIPSGTNTNIVPAEKESRLLLELPIIGIVIMKAFKVIWYAVSTVWSVIGFKLTALAFAAKIVFWMFNNSLSVILGVVAMFGFCKWTDKCSLGYVPDQLMGVSDALLYSIRNLEGGESMYGQ